jgi:hypothetical protein
MIREEKEREEEHIEDEDMIQRLTIQQRRNLIVPICS